MIFDLEADGLKPTKLHCISVNTGKKIVSTTDYAKMRKFFLNAKLLIGHNIQRFDIPVVERLLGIKVTAKLVDTLALSWYLEPKRLKHGLAEWGVEFGVPKPPIDDWENLTPEEYIHRCEEDVKINTKLWDKQWKALVRLYGSEEGAWRLVDYLAFKMDCAAEQEASRWKLDVKHAEEVRDLLAVEKEQKLEELIEAMPKVVKTANRTKPTKLYLKGKVNTLSVAGEKWFKLLKENDLPEDYDGVVEEVVDIKEPNPNSSDQVKSWLYGLGWVPETFEFKRNKETGEVKQIPQVNIKHGGGICPSIKRLYEQEPKLEVLDGLSILSHRISILNGFLSNVDEEGYVQAQVQGLTNTLRFKHRVVVNLPGIDKPYGSDIRGCLVAPEGYELCGSDMSSLEDRTKQHYMWNYDPDYVREMMTPDFDPHIDLSVSAGAMTKEDGHTFKNADKEFQTTALYKSLKAVRTTYKKANYTAVYGAGDATLARAAEVSLAQGAKIRDAYWKRNWSVLKIAEDQVVKTCLGMKWLYNPVSQLWYSLRHDKDRFSTLNQGTGVYCFDTWLKHIRNGGPPAIAQMHDETVLLVRKGQRERATRHLIKAMRLTNEELKLNRELDCSIQFGDSYSDVH